MWKLTIQSLAGNKSDKKENILKYVLYKKSDKKSDKIRIILIRII